MCRAHLNSLLHQRGREQHINSRREAQEPDSCLVVKRVEVFALQTDDAGLNALYVHELLAKLICTCTSHFVRVHYHSMCIQIFMQILSTNI